MKKNHYEKPELEIYNIDIPEEIMDTTLDGSMDIDEGVDKPPF